MKTIFDAIYRAAGWFSHLLRPAGWFDQELTSEIDHDGHAYVRGVEVGIDLGVVHGLQYGDGYIPSDKVRRKKHRVPFSFPAVAYVRGMELALALGALTAVGDSEPSAYNEEEVLLLLALLEEV